jgi:hypothetical protein
MFKYFLILSFLFSAQLHAQEIPDSSQTEKMVDSILNEFKNQNSKDIDLTSEEDKEKLIAAEEKYMNEFLLLERDREEAKKFKIYLQVLIGSVFVLLFIVVWRNSRKRRVGGR